MSKLKEKLLRQQEQQLEYMGKFLDYIYDNVISSELNSDELDEMERENISSQVSNRILSKNTFKQANNKNYHPLKGA